MVRIYISSERELVVAKHVLTRNITRHYMHSNKDSYIRKILTRLTNIVARSYRDYSQHSYKGLYKYSYKAQQGLLQALEGLLQGRCLQ